MALTVWRSLEAAAAEDKFLVIAGLGHLEYRFGVPERVDRHGLLAPERTVIVSVRSTADFPDHETEAVSNKALISVDRLNILNDLFRYGVRFQKRISE